MMTDLRLTAPEGRERALSEFGAPLLISSSPPVGAGSTQHMADEMLAATEGVKLLHVPYRNGWAPPRHLLNSFLIKVSRSTDQCALR